MKLFFLLWMVLATSCAPRSSNYNSLVYETLTPVTGRYILKNPTNYSVFLPRAEKFFELIQNDPTVLSAKFVGTHLDPANIIAVIASSKEYPAKITTYGWWKDKWSKVIAYHENGTIYLNQYKLLRPGCEIINTIVHEYMHRLKFSHAPGGPTGYARDNSIPYWFGDKAEAYCLKGLI